jgi:metallo-beta-lactamase class B
MKSQSTGSLAAVYLAASVFATHALGQANAAESHLAAAREAAGQDHPYLYRALCVSPASGPTTGVMKAPPALETWHAEPAKVFDNLYFVGEKEYSAWAVTTSAGIIIVDTIWDYSVEDEIVGGLKKLGLDPAQIKYAVVSHGHRDHVGGARYLQDHFGTRILMTAEDWDLVETSPRVPEAIKPKRDMIVSDGQKLTLGDTTLTLYVTPGHTLGTISTLIPVKDNGQPHLVAEWGGTGFNFEQSRERFGKYITSAGRFGDIVVKSGADVLIGNHTNQDGSKVKLPALAKRNAGNPHPYVIGNDSVRRYIKVAEECARAYTTRYQ